MVLVLVNVCQIMNILPSVEIPHATSATGELIQATNEPVPQYYGTAVIFSIVIICRCSKYLYTVNFVGFCLVIVVVVVDGCY